ncbi:MAG: (4Fe-4S)-binding protein [Sphingobacteriales bacterium]|nr:(4Fe-4S)-binding protein [Sphingobacteriales bacterium]
MEEIVKRYSNQNITVIWKPKMCIHSQKCFHGLANVFDPTKKPWVNIAGASSQKIIEQVNQCPSGALSWEYVNQSKNQTVATLTEVHALPNGPLMVFGDLHVKDAQGKEIVKQKSTAFCRCGYSSNKPFCDGSHKTANFNDH